jgi:hypothetical protein
MGSITTFSDITLVFVQLMMPMDLLYLRTLIKIKMS